MAAEVVDLEERRKEKVREVAEPMVEVRLIISRVPDTTQILREVYVTKYPREDHLNSQEMTGHMQVMLRNFLKSWTSST